MMTKDDVLSKENERIHNLELLKDIQINVIYTNKFCPLYSMGVKLGR